MKEIVYEFGEFVVDPHEKTLLAGGVPIHLPAKAFETLLLFIENNRTALSKDEMLSAIWQDSFVEDGNLAKYISQLRKILETNGSKYIETIPKHGYRFSADLKLIAKPKDEVVIIERQTVKRLTLSVGDETDREPLALPAAPSTRSRSALIALLVVAIAGVTYLGWRFSRTDVAVIDPYEPVRLTDSPYHDTGPTWTSDGRIRFHRIYSNDRHVAAVMNADGSGQSEITAADGRRIFSWSPDEQKVLFQKQGDPTRTYLANADGSGEVLLPFMAGSWSADSKMLAYRQVVGGNNHDIFTYSLDTGEIRNVTNSESFDADPSFSPDGKHILFASGRDGNSEIYAIDLDGGNIRRLTFDPGIDAHPAYSPDGTAILFSSDREKENGDVYIMRADGGGVVKLTRWDKSNETAGPGGWSPDGTKIAFFSDRNGEDDIYVVSAESIRPQLVYSDADHDVGSFSLSPDEKRIVFSNEMEDKSGELRVLDRETGRTTLVTKTELPFVECAWSPGGDRIVYSDRVNGNTEILLVDADGSDLENLTNDPSRDVSPAWSPDGSRIVFLTYRGVSTRAPRLHTASVDGGDLRPVTPQDGWEGDPVWSPVGNVLFFACDRTDIPGNLMDICQIGLDGTGEKRIVSRRDSDAQPAISPDGKWIAFTGALDRNTEVYIINVDGSGLRRLTWHPARDSQPVWSKDGRKLFFTSDRSGRSAIYETEVPS